MNVLKDFSRSLYDLMSASFEAFFPNHDHVNAFAALDLEAGLTWPDRKNLVEVLASYEKVCKTQLWPLLASGKHYEFSCALISVYIITPISSLASQC